MYETWAVMPWACAMPRASWPASSRKRARASVDQDRTLATRRASSGITLGASPAWMLPTVTTTGSKTSNRRVVIVCRAMTISQATGTVAAKAWIA